MGQKAQKYSAEKIASQKGKVFLVTGANTGLGLETCKVLASKGATVVMTYRNEKKSKKSVDAVKAIADANEGKVDTLVLDLADLESVKTAAENFKAKNMPLHCLINNAGVMMCPKQETKDGFEMQFGTNHLGHFAFTAHLFPVLEATAGSEGISPENPVRVVNLTSSYHSKGPKEGILFDNLKWDKDKTPKYNPNLAYGHSKFANVVFTQELRDRMQRFNGNMVTFAVHPGFVDTELTRHKEGQFGSLVIKGYKFFNGALSVKTGALTQLFCAVDKDPVEKRQSGEYFVPIAARRDLSKSAPKISKEMQTKLWKVSEELTGVAFLGEE